MNGAVHPRPHTTLPISSGKSSISHVLDDLPVILESAFRHGIAEEDMLHAVDNAVWIIPEEDGVLMHIGPARPGHPMLEVGVLRWHGVLAINHAMKARDKYLPR